MKKVGGILAGLAVFVATLGALFYLFERNADSRRSVASRIQSKVSFIDLGESHEIYERVFLRAPGSVMHAVLTKDNKVIYDQIYKTDKNLLRVPVAENNRATLHAIFGGCSYTWGEGLKEEETLPWLFQVQTKNVQAYNLGFPGGGINTLLRYFETFDLKNITSAEEGFFIYTFMSNHFDRFFARYNYLSWASKGSPYYEIENKRPVYKGEIKDQYVFKEFHAVRKAGLEHTLLHTQNVEDWSEQEISDFALAVKELERRYLEKYPRGKFVFVFHPDGGFGGQIRVVFKQQLEKLGIRYHDFEQEFNHYLKENNLTHLDMKIPDDGHPNEKMNKYLAKTLADALKKDYRNLKLSL